MLIKIEKYHLLIFNVPAENYLFIIKNRVHRLYSQHSIFFFVCLKPICSCVKA